MIHRDIIIYGRVQGVGYRFSARSFARKYSIKGFVRNLPDGSVYIEAEGNEDNVNYFISWCRQGPPGAIVDDLEISDGEMKNFSGFDIRM